MDNLVRCLGALPTRMDRTDVGILGRLLDSGDAGGRCFNLNRFDIDLLAFLDFNTESKRDNLRNVRVRAKDANGNAEAFTKQTHRLETLLVVGSSTPDKDFDGVRDEWVLVLLQGADDTLECGRYVREICDTTANNQDLAIGPRRSARDQVNYRGSDMTSQ